MDVARPRAPHVAAVAALRPPGLDVGRLLATAEDAAPVDAADVVGAELREMLGVSAVAFLVADLSGKALIRLGHAESPAATRTHGPETAEVVPLAGTAHGRALERQEVQTERNDHGWMLCAPVTNRGEAIGVLEVDTATEPDPDCVASVALAAHALAYIVVANRRFTDLFEWGQRSVPLSLAAEIQHRLLPAAYTCEATQFTLAAWLEPAGEIAGDTFDFSLDRDVLHLSMTDAMGHAVDAALLATVLVGALRNARRAGVGLAEQARRANDALAAQSDRVQFVTGQVVRIDLASGIGLIVNAGHPPPVRLRAGRVAPVELEADLPFGTGLDGGHRVQQLALEPGDRLFFVTDGIMERNAAAVDIASAVARSADLHPREAVQRLVGEVLAATGGRLEDDATVMCLDWHGGASRPRVSRSGANA